MDPLAELEEQESAEPWSYAAKLFNLSIVPDYTLPPGTVLIKVKDCIVRDEYYASAHTPSKDKLLGGQAFMLIINKDPLHRAWGAPSVELTYYHRLCKEWFSIEVPPDYPIRTLTEDERRICGSILRRTSGGSVHEERGPRFKGSKSGRGMMEAWGYYFERHIREPGGREQIVHAMVAEFPDRADKIERWVDSYKSYYNLGRLPGCKPQAVKLDFIPSAAALADPLSQLED